MSSDSLLAEQLLGRPYKGVPWKGAEYMTIPDTSSQSGQYSCFQLAENGTSTNVIDLDDDGTEVTFIVDLKSSNSTPYTATTQIVPKAGGWLTFLDHVEVVFAGSNCTISEPATSAAYIGPAKFAVEETLDYATANGSSLCYALDTSASLVPSLALGATGAAAYSGIGSSAGVNGGLTVRQAIWAQNAWFNAFTNSWRCQVHIPAKYLHDAFRRQGCVYGLPVSQLKLWFNTGATVMPVVVLTGDAQPIITVLTGGASEFRYRRMVPTVEFQRTLMSHLSEKADETYEFLSQAILPSANGLTSPNLNNINLSSVPSIVRLWVFLCPSGAAASATSLYPGFQAIGMNQVMIRCGGEQLYQRQLALASATGQYEYQEIFRTVQDSCVADAWTHQNIGQLGAYNWRTANRIHCFPIRAHEQVMAAQNILFQAVLAADINGVTPSPSTPVDVAFFADYTRWIKKSYKKDNGTLVPVWTVVD